jgi:hypothetical protein
LSLAATCVLLILTQIYELHVSQECVEVPQDQSSPTVLQCNGMLPAPKQAQNMYVKIQNTKKLIDKTDTRLKGHHDS